MAEIVVEALHPVDELIKQFVDYYYILNPGKQNLSNAYTAYPSINTPVIFFENTNVIANGQQHLLEFSKDLPYYCGVLGRFTTPVDVTIKGKIKTINIIFKATGINAFMNKYYAQVVKDTFQHFNEWNIDEPFIASLFQLPADKLVSQLDALLLQQHRPFVNDNLQAAIRLMNNEDHNYEINEIEQMLNINRKTLLRLFKLHTGISPTAFRRIIRFRHALEKNKSNDYSLTQLAYEANFTDQSHFIKEVRKLTRDKPSDFIKEATYVKGSKFLIKQHK